MFEMYSQNESSTRLLEIYSKNDSSTIIYVNGLRKTQIPAAILLIAIGICGILGNVFILNALRTRFSPSNYKVFISTVSLIDLFACSFAIPLELVLMFTGYTIDGSGSQMCKLSRFSDVYLTVSSAFVLTAISIDRYKKVCKPFGGQISPIVAKFICAGSLVVAALVSWPSVFVFGEKTSITTVGDQRAVITDCTLLNKATVSRTAFIFLAFLQMLSVIGIVIVIIIYCLINSKAKNLPMWDSTKNRWVKTEDSTSAESSDPEIMASNKGDKCQREITPDDVAVQDFDDLPTQTEEDRHKQDSTETYKSEDTDTTVVTVHVNVLSAGSMISIFCTSSSGEIHADISNPCYIHTVSEEPSILDKTVVPKLSMSHTKGQSTPLKTRKLTFQQIKSSFFLRKSRNRSVSRINLRGRVWLITRMMFVVFIIYILNYVPTLTILVLRSISEDFATDTNPVKQTITNFLIKSYFFNCGVNPVVYILFDKKLQAAGKEFLSVLKHKVISIINML